VGADLKTIYRQAQQWTVRLWGNPAAEFALVVELESGHVMGVQRPAEGIPQSLDQTWHIYHHARLLGLSRRL
jgi:hypothetical protein